MDTMTEIAVLAGGSFMVVGAAIVMVYLIGLLWDCLATVWIDASNRWRNICKAESLIHEYRRERESYLKWRADNGGEDT